MLGRLIEFDATFAERDARAVALEASTGVGIEGSLDALQRLRSSSDVLALADGSRTTRGHRASERETVAIAERLAGASLAPLPAGLVQQQTRVLDAELRTKGGGLSVEQRAALELACSDRQLVVIEGQAGTGKSTVLTAIARAHQADGREIIATSTGALAAQRLANELTDAGVDASSYSTVALCAAIASGRVALGPEVTVIHDEAALASTREQRRLFEAVEVSGARLIEVGDPRQSQAVGAGGLWPHLEHAARANRAMVELTRNVRVQDAADRRDQQWFREGEHEQSLNGYDARGRVILAEDRRHAEDTALERAHADRRAGQDTVVIVQTSNERLDELKARAQAIRIDDGELGDEVLPIPGRPYELRSGDEVQIRRTITAPEHGQLRNGATARVTEIDQHAGRLTLRLSDGRDVDLRRAQIDRGDVRLAYVQHPFPAQGRTTDTAHAILGEHTTQEGSYVAITRARESTHIYASHDQLNTDAPELGDDQVRALGERMGRSEPEVPSIHTPVAHEHAIAAQHAQDITPQIGDQYTGDAVAQQSLADGHVLSVLGLRPRESDPDREVWYQAADAIEGYRSRYQITEATALGSEPPAGEFEQRHARRLTAELVLDALDQLGQANPRPGSLEERIRNTPGLATPDVRLGRERTIGWEP